ncbi:MAG: sucA, partial [Proteobacteria bacterium]|nr:sucA [Pseudomonadota bacterium]
MIIDINGEALLLSPEREDGADGSETHMARQNDNDAFAGTSFLYGGNATYIEALEARYLADPTSVDPEWRDFFDALSEPTAARGARSASWSRSDWPPKVNGELVSALDGNWPEAGKILEKKIEAKAQPVGISAEELRQATLDSVRAIMMIRAYRMRGHLHADLDPIGVAKKLDHEELHPTSYGFTEADMDRPIFIDHVLGLEYATVRQMIDILKRTYCGTIGYEFMHISSPEEKAWIQERIEGPDKQIEFTDNGKKA